MEFPVSRITDALRDPTFKIKTQATNFQDMRVSLVGHVLQEGGWSFALLEPYSPYLTGGLLLIRAGEGAMHYCIHYPLGSCGDDSEATYATAEILSILAEGYTTPVLYFLLLREAYGFQIQNLHTRTPLFLPF